MPGEESRERSRLTGIYRNWQRAARAPRSSSGLLSSDRLKEILLMLVLCAGIILLPIDGRMMMKPGIVYPSAFLQSLPYYVVTAETLVLYLFNSLAINRFLDLEAGETKRVSRWLRMLRLLFAGLPLVGIVVIFGWRRLSIDLTDSVQQSPRRELQLCAERPLVSLRLRHCHLLDRLTRRLSTPAGLATWLIANFYCVYTLAALFSGSASRAAVSIMSWLLHLVICVWTCSFVWSSRNEIQSSNGEKAVALALPAVALLPVPLLPVLVLGAALFLLPDRSGETMIRTSFESRASVERLSPWLRLQEHLRRSWRSAPWQTKYRQRPQNLDRPVEDGFARREILALCGEKSSCLALETAGMIWALRRLTGKPSQPARFGLDVAAGCAFILALVLATIGLSCMLIRFIQKLARVEGRLSILDRYPYASYLAGSQLAFSLGLILGDGLERGDGGQVVGVLMLGGLFGAAIHFVPLFLSLFLPVPVGNTRENNTTTLWMLLFAFTGMIGVGMAYDTVLRQLYLRTFGLLIGAAALISPGAATRRLNWLLRPLTARDILSQFCPARIRWALIFFVGTAILPLGGLATPLWLYFHHRLWPSFVKDRYGRS